MVDPGSSWQLQLGSCSIYLQGVPRNRTRMKWLSKKRNHNSVLKWQGPQLPSRMCRELSAPER